MRVIAGSAKRTNLKTIRGLATRPTTDRIKETLFNMIDPWICDCIFLDLFAGSGAIGIEALSRGAKKTVFIEKNPKAVSVIKENLITTKLSDRALILQGDVVSRIHSLSDEGPFDYIFMDPPYNLDLEKRVLYAIDQAYKSGDQRLLSQDGVIIVEASIDTDLSFINELSFQMIKEKRYKTNKHVFITVQEE